MLNFILMNFATKLRNEIKKSALQYTKKHNITEFTETDSAIIFNSSNIGYNANFLKPTFKEIETNEKWSKRLDKTHTYFDDGTKELESSNSSDALLMNIFCHPSFQKWSGPSKYLNVKNEEPTFGWNPEIEAHNHPTEIDMKIGHTIFEAKLTEKDFTLKNKEKVLDIYPGIENLFELDDLEVDDSIKHYQLLRNIYAAYKRKLNFMLLIDARRPDLIQYFIEVLKSIQDYELRKKCDLVTWQEVASTVGKDLKTFLKLKYAIN